MAHGAHGWPMSNIFESDVCAIGCSKVKVFADFDWGQFKDSEKMEKLKLLGQIGESILSWVCERRSFMLVWMRLHKYHKLTFRRSEVTTWWFDVVWIWFCFGVTLVTQCFPHSAWGLGPDQDDPVQLWPRSLLQELHRCTMLHLWCWGYGWWFGECILLQSVLLGRSWDLGP